MATNCSILAWRILWTEKPGLSYSPCGHKEKDKTEQLTLSLFTFHFMIGFVNDRISIILMHKINFIICLNNSSLHRYNLDYIHIAVLLILILK